MMRLMILSDGHVYRTDGHYWSRDPWLKLVGYLLPYFSFITVCVPLRKYLDTESAVDLAEGWDRNKVAWVHTFPHETVINYYKLLPLMLAKNIPVLVKAVQDSDLIFTRLPAMNGFLVSLLAFAYKKPLFCYFSGDQRIQILHGGKYRGLQAFPAHTIAKLHDFLNYKIVKKSSATLFEARETLERFYSNGNKCYFMFPSTIESCHIFRRTVQMNEDGVVRLLFVGRLAPEKGINYLLRAMRLLTKEDDRFRLTICGDGPEKEALEELTRELDLARLVEFKGHVRWGENLIQIYRKSDILVLPSLSEGVPKVVLEAMANGVVVVTTKVGGMREIIQNGENGILVERGSEAAIFEAIKKLASCKGMRGHIIENGYKFVSEHTSERQAEKLVRIIMESLPPKCNEA